MSNWNYYTVKLDNKKYASGVTGGTIEYSEIMCGDHLVPIRECGCKI